MTSEMTAGDLPVPPIVVGGEAPADAMPEASPEEERRRRRKRALLLLLLGLLAMLVTIAIWYLIFRQPITPPLPLIPDSQLPAYSTAIYGIQRPAGVAVSPSGDRIYVTQSAGDRTGIVFDGAGNKIGTMTPPPTTGTDHSPVYIAVDPLTSEVYGWQPLGLAFDKAGTLYATDMSGPYQKVLVIDRSANVVRTIGENDNLNFPNGVGVDDAGTVYVTDGNNGRLLAFDAQGRISGQVGRGTGQGNLGLPRGLAVDDKGRIFVADATGQGVFVFRGPSTDSRRFDFLGFLGGEGVGDAQFEYPNATAIDARGRMYVADTYNDRVQIWSY
jgi:DNA-binding beta-propeller fold protein YncE